MINKILILLLFISTGLTAQTKTLEISAFITSDGTIFLEDKEVTMKELAKEVRIMAYNKNGFEYDHLVYKIYGAKNLKLGTIMDVNSELYSGFRLSSTGRKRFLLKEDHSEMEPNNWQGKIEGLEIQSIDH